ncbi:MAG: hypothetical protein P1P84_16980 [Deferrisomatales bacterium]|nr:hypothetical protein [Deferrisomatales bacterium]
MTNTLLVGGGQPIWTRCGSALGRCGVRIIRLGPAPQPNYFYGMELGILGDSYQPRQTRVAMCAIRKEPWCTGIWSPLYTGTF